MSQNGYTILVGVSGPQLLDKDIQWGGWTVKFDRGFYRLSPWQQGVGGVARAVG